MSKSTALRICPLCEATCGLELDFAGREVQSIRGDRSDIFSEGFLCPKGLALEELDADPDRLREPMIRDEGGWRAASWDEAFEDIERNLTRIISEHGRDAVGLYLGNPSVHNTALMVYIPALRNVLRTQNVFTASSVDQIPKQLVVGLMFGSGLSVPVPDIDRCQHLVILGANPLVSNGSLLTAPNIGKRLKRLRQRGGKIVVIDPCRTKTARAADEHHFIQPGTDAFLLFGIVHTLFEENLASLGRLEPLTAGLEQVKDLAKAFSPESVSARCGIDAQIIRTMAREIAAAEGAAVYGRIGTCTQSFGTLASWLPEVIHVLTGNLDREGGAMFPLAAHGPSNTKGASGSGRGLRTGRWTSRVRGCPEIFGELPVSCLSEEILTPGPGQIRAMLTVAGNPVLSTPGSDRVSAALDSLDYMVSMDIYLNETTRHANVILPGLSPLESSHYDLVFSQLAIHNSARYSPPMFDAPEGQWSEWESLLRLVGVFSGMGPRANTKTIDDDVMLKLIQREVKTETSSLHGRDPNEILEALQPRLGPDRVVDFMLRAGPYGDGFGAKTDGLSLDVLRDKPHGIDLGPLRPRVPEILRTPSGKIELAPALVVDDVARLQKTAPSTNGQDLLLIGRRDLRSNNSWMHNVECLATDDRRCTLHMNPEDAGRAGLEESQLAAVTSRVGSIDVCVEITGDIRPGVVSIPHGWGHDSPHVKLDVANNHAGVNSNELADQDIIDVPSGNAVLCGIPVTVTPAADGQQ